MGNTICYCWVQTSESKVIKKQTPNRPAHWGSKRNAGEWGQIKNVKKDWQNEKKPFLIEWNGCELWDWSNCRIQAYSWNKPDCLLPTGWTTGEHEGRTYYIPVDNNGTPNGPAQWERPKREEDPGSRCTVSTDPISSSRNSGHGSITNKAYYNRFHSLNVRFMNKRRLAVRTRSKGADSPVMQNNLEE